MKSLGDRLTTVAWALTLALLVALPLFAGYSFDARVLTASAAAFVCALIACIACALGSSQVRMGLGTVAWLLGAFLLWLVISTTRSVYLNASLLNLVQMASYVAILALCATLFADGARRRLGWYAVALAGAIEGVIGIRDWTQTVIFQGDPSWRIFGTMFNPNVLAGYMLVVIPAAVVVLVAAWRQSVSDDEERPRYLLIAAGFAVLVSGAALLLTGSRAGLLGALFGTVIFLIAAPTRIRARWMVLGALALVVLVLVAPPLRNRLVSATTQSHSAVFRWYTWLGTVEMIEARPLLGFGPGSFEYAYPRYASVGFTRMAHQAALQLAAEAGLPALALMVLIVGLLARRMTVGLRATGLRAVECAAGLAALAALGLQNMADYSWYIPAVGMTLSAVVGLAVAASRRGAPRMRVRWPCIGGALVALALLIVCGIGLRAQMLAARGQSELARGRYQTAAGWLRQAHEINPLDAEVLQDYAQAVAGSLTGGYARAIELRLRTTELNPLDAGNLLALAELYDAVGEPTSAAQAAEEAIRVHPNYPRAYVVLARVQEQLGEHERVLETFRALERLWESPIGRYQALEEVSDFSWAYAWLALGDEAAEKGDIEAADDYYRRAGEVAGGYAALQRSREEPMRALGTWREAEVREAERLVREAQRGLTEIGRRDQS